MRNISDKSCRENKNARFMFSNFFENPVVYENVKKCGGARGAAGNMVHAQCMVDK
jgi:hypothetical protein